MGEPERLLAKLGDMAQFILHAGLMPSAGPSSDENSIQSKLHGISQFVHRSQQMLEGLELPGNTPASVLVPQVVQAQYHADHVQLYTTLNELYQKINLRSPQPSVAALQRSLRDALSHEKMQLSKFQSCNWSPSDPGAPSEPPVSFLAPSHRHCRRTTKSLLSLCAADRAETLAASFDRLEKSVTNYTAGRSHCASLDAPAEANNTCCLRTHKALASIMEPLRMLVQQTLPSEDGKTSLAFQDKAWRVKEANKLRIAARKRQKEQKNLLRQMMIQKEEARIFAHASQIAEGELRKEAYQESINRSRRIKLKPRQQLAPVAWMQEYGTNCLKPPADYAERQSSPEADVGRAVECSSLSESKPAETSSHHVPLSLVELIHTERWGDGDATRFLRAAVENDQAEDRTAPVVAPEIGSPVGVPQWHERGLSSVRDGTLRNSAWSCLSEYLEGRNFEGKTSVATSMAPDERSVTPTELKSQGFTDRMWSSATMLPPHQFNPRQVNKVVTLEYGLDGTLASGHVEVCQTRVPPSWMQCTSPARLQNARHSASSPDSWRTHTI